MLLCVKFAGDHHIMTDHYGNKYGNKRLFCQK